MSSHAGQDGAIEPTPELMMQFAQLPDSGPVVMLNLLKFKPGNGQPAYMKYAAAIQPILQKHGASTVYAGRAELCLLGGQQWDVVALIKYPSRRAFLEMVTSAEYQAIHHHRVEGLAHQVLYATAPASA